MGFRMHRSIQLIPGLRLNMSKSGFGLSAGGKGFHVATMPNGRTRRTISIPGTGMSWISQTSSGTHARGAAPRPTAHTTVTPTSPEAPPPPPPIAASPGFFASHDEKQLAEAIRNHDTGTMEQIASRTPNLALAATTTAAFVHLQRDEDDIAEQQLLWVFTNGDPGADAFIRQYVSLLVTVEVVDGVTVSLEPDRSTVGLLLAELMQRDDQVAKAIAVVEQLPPTTLTALSLAELNTMAGHFDEVISITEGCTNVDDATALLCTFRGIAFREQKQFTAARACFTDALRSKKRNPIVRHRALFERSKCYLAEGQRARAKADLERIMAEDSDYDGLREALAALDPTSNKVTPPPTVTQPPAEFDPTRLGAF